MIKRCQMDDCHILAKLAKQLWNEHHLDELEKEFEDLMSKNTAFFVDYEDNKPVAFAQVSLRHDYVEGTNTSPIAYLEGIFVERGYRNRGIAKKLLEKCELWAKENFCTQLASDCELENNGSYKFHLNCGFEEVNKIICFVKKL